MTDEKEIITTMLGLDEENIIHNRRTWLSKEPTENDFIFTQVDKRTYTVGGKEKSYLDVELVISGCYKAVPINLETYDGGLDMAFEKIDTLIDELLRLKEALTKK